MVQGHNRPMLRQSHVRPMGLSRAVIAQAHATIVRRSAREQRADQQNTLIDAIDGHIRYRTVYLAEVRERLAQPEVRSAAQRAYDRVTARVDAHRGAARLAARWLA